MCCEHIYTDECVVKTLVEKGLAMEVLHETTWWRRLDHLSYLHHSQHLVLGHHAWIISHMEKVSLNAKGKGARAYELLRKRSGSCKVQR